MIESQKSYPADAFHPSLGGRMAAGKLSVGRHHLCFEADTARLPQAQESALRIELPLAKLNIRSGGLNGEKIFLEHPDQPGCSICVSDAEILEHDALKHHPQRQLRLAAVKRQRMAWRALLIFAAAVLLGILALIVLLVANKERLVRALAAKIPMSWEQQLGDSLFDRIRSEGKIVNESGPSAELAAVTRRLVPAIAERGYAFEFHIVADLSVNAFALPGACSGEHRLAARGEAARGIGGRSRP